MKKFKLIREYPNSPKIGTIAENKDEHNCYHLSDVFHQRLNSMYIENYPEFWEEVKDPLLITEDGFEVFLAGIFQRESSRDSPVLFLLHIRFEAHRTHHVSAVESDAEVIAMFSYLCRNRDSEDQQQNQQPKISIHYQLKTINYKL